MPDPAALGRGARRWFYQFQAEGQAARPEQLVSCDVDVIGPGTSLPEVLPSHIFPTVQGSPLSCVTSPLPPPRSMELTQKVTHLRLISYR
jgi:hypothetical protein